MMMNRCARATDPPPFPRVVIGPRARTDDDARDDRDEARSRIAVDARDGYLSRCVCDARGATRAGEGALGRFRVVHRRSRGHSTITVLTL